MSAIDDLNAGKGWIMGIIAFTGAVAGVSTTIFGWEVEKVTAVALVAVGVVIGLGFVIQRSENRSAQRLEAHIKESNTHAEGVNNSLNSIKDMLLESQRSTLRIELNNAIARTPENHDTILRMAERYFSPIEKGGLEGNWYESSIVLDWAAEEGVKLPTSLRGLTRD